MDAPSPSALKHSSFEFISPPAIIGILICFLIFDIALYAIPGITSIIDALELESVSRAVSTERESIMKNRCTDISPQS